MGANYNIMGGYTPILPKVSTMKIHFLSFVLLSLFLIFPVATTIANEEFDEEQVNKKPDADAEDPLSGAEVTILKQKERTIEEYRVNGKLLQVKIIPKHGYPYYLIDTDGNGSFDVRSSEAWKNTTVNTWKIFEW